MTTELWGCLKGVLQTLRGIGSDSSPFSQEIWLSSSFTCFPSHGWPVNKCVFSLVNDGRSLSIKMHYIMRWKPWDLETDEINLMIYCLLFSWASLLNVEQFLLQYCTVILDYFQTWPFLNKAHVEVMLEYFKTCRDNLILIMFMD